MGYDAFPAPWPYGYSGAVPPGAGVFPPGSNPLCEGVPVGNNPEKVEVEWPHIERETQNAVLVRWETRKGPRLLWVPFSQMETHEFEQRMRIAKWLIAKNNLQEVVKGVNPEDLEDYGDTPGGASIMNNPLYPIDQELDYEGMRVSYDIKSKPWPDEIQFSSAEQIAEFAEKEGMLDDTRERLYALYLDTAARPIGYRLVSAGSLRETMAHPREFFGPAVALASESIVMLHNHPSGQLRFSPEDTALTRRFQKAATLLGLRLLDSIVVSRDGYVSANEEGWL